MEIKEFDCQAFGEKTKVFAVSKSKYLKEEADAVAFEYFKGLDSKVSDGHVSVSSEDWRWQLGTSSGFQCGAVPVWIYELDERKQADNEACWPKENPALNKDKNNKKKL